ncbi:MAG: beta-galactosidase [Terriglobia bacterium]
MAKLRRQNRRLLPFACRGSLWARGLVLSAFCLLLSSAWAPTGELGAEPSPPPQRPFDIITWNGGKFVYGVDYYPESWDESTLQKDAEMMQTAGINFVRMGEFAWTKMEPEEGHFDFIWLDHALKVLSAHGIKAVLGTPTAAPPAWLMAKYPDIAAMDRNGVRYRFGSRDNRCLNNPHYRAATRAIVTALAEHYKNNPAVLGWQIDNELGGPECYDPYCQRAFQDWCRKKYETLDAVNRAWGAIFWSHTYTAWSQIPLPWNTLGDVHNPGLALDYDRFFSDTTHDYLAMQVAILRRIAPNKPITHNEMGMFDGIDYSELDTSLDFVAWDNYPLFDPDFSDYFGAAIAHDLMRGGKHGQNFMVMEEQGGLPGWNTFWGKQAPAALYRVWAYQAIAHGADGISFFRWRTSPYGTEQYWQGVLDQDSYPNARYRMVAQMGREVQKLAPLLDGSTADGNVAVLVSPDSRWAFHIQPLVKDFDYNRELHDYYDAFRRAGIGADVLFPPADFAKYKVIAAPSLFVVTPELAAKLTRFVEGGGTLVLSFRSGVKDEHNEVTRQTLPGPFAKLAGIAIHEFDPQTNQKQELIESDGGRFPAHVWFDVLTPTTARTLATYADDFYAGKAAVTENHFGGGHVYYVGTESGSKQFYNQLANRVLKEAGVKPGPQLPVGVEFQERVKPGARIMFLLNYTNQTRSVHLGRSLQNALTDAMEPSSVDLQPYGVKVLVERAAQ